jgi:Bacterial Ig-like domain (group 2)
MRFCWKREWPPPIGEKRMRRLMQRHANLLFQTIQLVVFGALCVSLLFAPACGYGPSDPRLTSLTVSPGALDIPLGNSGQFRAMGKFDDGSMRDLTTSVSWESTGGNVALISSSGSVRTLTVGQALVRAKYRTVVASANLTVSPAILLSLSVNPSTGVIPLGGALQLSAMGRFSDKSARDISNSVIWASSDPTVAAVSQGGQVNAKAVGGATVSAAQGSVNGSAGLSITPAALVSITVSADNPSIPIGDSTQVRAQGKFTDNSSRDITTLVSWTSSSPGVVSISSGGLAQAKALGAANMIASVNQISGFQTVTAIPAALNSISVSSTQYLLPLGTNAQLTATGNYSDGSQQDLTNSVQWSSSSPQIVSISNSGLATANAIGSATALASSGTTSGSAQLSVSPAQLIGIDVSPQNPLVPVGQRQQMTATGSYTDGTKYDLTRYVTWSSDNPQIASVDKYGMAVAVNVGTAKISASYQGQNASSMLTVQPLLSINFFTLPLLAPDTTLRISYPDASTKDVCAMIYVFDQDQQLAECCGCVVSQDGLRTLSLQKDLTGNPLTGVKSTVGTVDIVAADHVSNPSCDASAISPSGSLVSWSTNLQAAGNGRYAVQEASGASSPLTDAQISALQAQCYFVKILGTGQGICSCGLGN